MDDVMLSDRGANIGRIKHSAMFRTVRQVAVPVERQITRVFGLIRQKAALGPKSPIYD